MGRFEIQEIGVSEFSSGEHPPSIVVVCEKHRRFIGPNRDYSCQTRRFDIQDIRVSEFSSGEHPPGVVVCVKGNMLFGQWRQGSRFGWRRIDGPIVKDA